MGRETHRSPKDPKVTVRSFLCRQRDESSATDRPADLLASLCEEAPEPGAALGWLSAYDAEATIREAALIMLFTAAKDPSVPRAARRPLLRAAGRVLLKAFKDPTLSDDLKFDVGPMISLCGLEVSDAEYVTAFQDFESVRARRVEEALRSQSCTVDTVERHLESIGLMSDEGSVDMDDVDLGGALSLASTAARVNPPLGATLLCIITAIAREHGRDDLDLLLALEEAAATRTPEAAWYLREIAAMPGMAAAGDRALQLSAGLHREGIHPEARGPAFQRGHVSGVDGSGSRSLALLFGSALGTDCFTLLLNDEVGIKDLFCVYEEGEEAARMLCSIPGGIPDGPCDMALARELLGESLAIHGLTSRPVPGRFLLYRYLLGPEPLEARRRSPDLSAYRLEKMPVGPRLVHGSEALAENPLCLQLYCASDDAYRFVERHLVKDRRGRARIDTSPADLEEFFQRIVTRGRLAVIGRLAANLEVEALAGRAARAQNRALARLYLAMVREAVPFGDIPFIRALNATGMILIAENLAAGYRTQKEVNEDGLIEEAQQED
jgi:hypothetical protein